MEGNRQKERKGWRRGSMTGGNAEKRKEWKQKLDAAGEIPPELP
jgi:hypothetical protein